MVTWSHIDKQKPIILSTFSKGLGEGRAGKASIPGGWLRVSAVAHGQVGMLRVGGCAVAVSAGERGRRVTFGGGGGGFAAARQATCSQSSSRVYRPLLGKVRPAAPASTLTAQRSAIGPGQQ
ncbi:UNVERIFIED_CONTAM: hypothetical protein K2H54_033111 [Gekko kuhli]